MKRFGAIITQFSRKLPAQSGLRAKKFYEHKKSKSQIKRTRHNCALKKPPSRHNIAQHNTFTGSQAQLHTPPNTMNSSNKGQARKTELHQAAEDGVNATVQKLLRAGTDKDAVDEVGDDVVVVVCSRKEGAAWCECGC